MGNGATGWTNGASAMEGSRFAEFQRRLTAYNAARFRPGLPDETGSHELALEYTVAQAEIDFVEAQRVAIAPLTRGVPTDVDSFVAWFENLKVAGPGQGNPLFPWLATAA